MLSEQSDYGLRVVGDCRSRNGGDLHLNHRERIFATLRGEKTDHIPFIPRLEIWFNANKYNDSLPQQYKSATLRELVEDLDLGYHAVIPNFKDVRCPSDEVDRGLGVFRLPTIPYRTELHGINRCVSYEGDVMTVEYETPVGRLRTRVLYDEGMRRGGITLSHILEYAIKSVDDFEAVGYIFENAEVLPNYDSYEEYSSYVGDLGIVVGFMSLAASPMQFIMRELMPMDQFFFAVYDYPDELARLSKRIGLYFDRMLRIVADSPADVVLSGGNYDAGITYPSFFEEHIAPFLKKQAETLHKAGKFLLSHTDGENRGLLELFVQSGIDVADSVCPAPMTSLSLNEVQNAFGGDVTIWGGLPSICVLEDSMGTAEFCEYVHEIFSELKRKDHLIVALADTVPPNASFERLKYIAEVVRGIEV